MNLIKFLIRFIAANLFIAVAVLYSITALWVFDLGEMVQGGTRNLAIFFGFPALLAVGFCAYALARHGGSSLQASIAISVGAYVFAMAGTELYWQYRDDPAAIFIALFFGILTEALIFKLASRGSA